MSLIDHLSIGVPSIKDGVEFYTPLLTLFECKLMLQIDNLAAYGIEKPEFLLMLPHDKQAYSTGNGVHIGFHAKTQSIVDKAYEYTLIHGGTDEGKPGPREAYPMEVYTSYVRDPFGNKLEFIYNGFSA